MIRPRPIACLGVLLLLLLAASPLRADGGPVAVPEPTEKALRFYRTGMVFWGVNVALGVLVPGLILASGLSARMESLARRIGRGWLVPTVSVFGGLYLLFTTLVEMPYDFYLGYLRPHEYGLSNQTLGLWFGDLIKGMLVWWVGFSLVGWVPFFLIARSPKRWWFYTGLLVLPFLLFGAFVRPLAIDPLFNDFGPMKDKALEARILDLAHRAGIDDGRVCEVDKSRDTNALNAYVTGMFGSKRIVLWDTLLKAMTPEQVLAVMGHEMGHYVLDHVWWGLSLSTLGSFLALFLIDRLGRRVLARWGDRWRIHALSSVAALPLLIILSRLLTLAGAPVTNYVSQSMEHEADRFALEITRDNRSAALAFVTMQHKNLSVPRPGRFYKIVRSTHPVLGERIDFCNAYRPWETGEPLIYSSRFRAGPMPEDR